MISCQAFYDSLLARGIDLFTGVPDSLLKDFCAYVTDHTAPDRNITAANEGGAIGVAAGYYLATKKCGLVYMQNAGQGNTVNPLVSLADPDVYGLPMLLLIGWRGEPGKHDEPQHVKQGKITIALLDAMGIPYDIVPGSPEAAARCLDKAVSVMNERSMPYALVVQKGTFEPYKLKKKVSTNFGSSREDAVRMIVEQLDAEDAVVSTTGMTSRELFELREQRQEGHERDFLTVGAMGHASQIALGIAIARPSQRVYCLDGDGALIMHLGSLAIIGQLQPKNLKHIVVNNGAHDSVGGQPTAAFSMDILSIAKACGYTSAFSAASPDEITAQLARLKSTEGPCLLEIKVDKGARDNLGRPTTTPQENKAAFIRFLDR